MLDDGLHDPNFHTGDEVLGKYTIVHRNGLRAPRGPAEPIDRGGAGTAYRVTYKGVQDRVLKVLTMSSRREDSSKRTADYVDTFVNEQRMLGFLAHGNIARLFEFGDDLEHDDRMWEYHITEWVEGEHLLQELKAADTSKEQCFSLLSQVIRAVRYMHEIGVGHGDIKSDNIRCRHLSDKTRQAVLLDLGSVQIFGDDADSILGNTRSGKGLHDSDKLTNTFSSAPFVTSDRILHPDFVKYRNKPLKAAELKSVFPAHDLYSIGILLREVINEPGVRGKFEMHLGSNGMRSLDLIIDRLTPRRIADRHYQNVSDLYLDWEKLSSDYVSPAGVPELGVAADFKYSMSTPLGRVVITDRLSQLAGHKMFERLGEIPQLELLRLKFSSATHTRAEHAALTFRNTRYYLSHLLNGPVFRLLVSAHELEASLILALLHDIGHYQLSHFFEDYASEQRQLRSNSSTWAGLAGPAAAWRSLDFDIPSDDDLFLSVFDYRDLPSVRGGYGSVIKKAVSASAKSHRIAAQGKMSEIAERCFGSETSQAVIDIHESVYRGTGEVRSAYVVLGGVLSSALDADKVSYLTQDAVQTGVKFGLGIDLDGLLGSLRSPSPEDIANARGPLLAISTKGTAAAESVLHARKLMYERVYWHPTNRAITAMIKFCLTRLMREGKFDMREFLSQNMFEPYTSALRNIHRMYDKANPGPHPNPIAYILDGERSIYRVLAELSPERGASEKKLTERLHDLTVFDIAALEDAIFDEVDRRYPRLDVFPGEILIDVPAKDRSKPGGERGGSVLVYEGNQYGRGRKLENVTPMVASIVREHKKRGRICRIFISTRLDRRLTSSNAANLTNFVRELIELHSGLSSATVPIHSEFLPKEK